MRQIVLDTETTGLEPEQGHRVIEIGAVELIDRKLTGRHFHKYVNPERDIDDGAFEVHGLSREFLRDKPLFGEVAGEFIRFVDGAELVIHNAGFDISFLDYELSLLENMPASVTRICTIVDSLALARHKHPGQKNNLDALCRRYGVDSSARTLHGALLDAEILADVYLAMTGGQTTLFAAADRNSADVQLEPLAQHRLEANRPPLKIIEPSAEELACHESLLDVLEAASGSSVWRQISGTPH